MTKQEIIDRFRQENPDITDRVLSDTVLASWAEVGELESATRGRLVRASVSFSSIASNNGETGAYNLVTQLPTFYDIDDFPGGGVTYSGKRISPTTFQILDVERPNWRTASGTPQKYIRYNDTIVFDRLPSAVATVKAYCIVKTTPFTNLNAEPFNELSYLEPFHYVIVLYLTMRAKNKLGKNEDAMKAQQEYESYIKWMKNEVNRGVYQTIQFRPPSLNNGGYPNRY